MKWLINLLTSSIGQKVVMSLTGLFLVTFLIVHLAGNLQLLTDSTGDAFNLYAYKMTHNPFIKTVSWSLYALILLHAVQGLLLWNKNRGSKGSNYKVKTGKNASFASRNMALLGTIILLFIIGHMAQFWGRMKFGSIEKIDIAGKTGVKDLYTLVDAAFASPLIVGLYLVSVIALFFHLQHGFQSAFQSLGINHPKYTPIIKGAGTAISFVLCAGFAIIPIMMYFNIQL